MLIRYKGVCIASGSGIWDLLCTNVKNQLLPDDSKSLKVFRFILEIGMLQRKNANGITNAWYLPIFPINANYANTLQCTIQ